MDVTPVTHHSESVFGAAHCVAKSSSSGYCLMDQRKRHSFHECCLMFKLRRSRDYRLYPFEQFETEELLLANSQLGEHETRCGRFFGEETKELSVVMSIRLAQDVRLGATALEEPVHPLTGKK